MPIAETTMGIYVITVEGKRYIISILGFIAKTIIFMEVYLSCTHILTLIYMYFFRCNCGICVCNSPSQRSVWGGGGGVEG